MKSEILCSHDDASPGLDLSIGLQTKDGLHEKLMVLSEGAHQEELSSEWSCQQVSTSLMFWAMSLLAFPRSQLEIPLELDAGRFAEF
jgi:hypothetical protein